MIDVRFQRGLDLRRFGLKTRDLGRLSEVQQQVPFGFARGRLSATLGMTGVGELER